MWLLRDWLAAFYQEPAEDPPARSGGAGGAWSLRHKTESSGKGGEKNCFPRLERRLWFHSKLCFCLKK